VVSSGNNFKDFLQRLNAFPLRCLLQTAQKISKFLLHTRYFLLHILCQKTLYFSPNSYCCW